MNGEKYISNAKSAEEHLNNALFQAANVDGWIQHGSRDLAATKANCLLEAAQLLVAAFEAEAREKRGQEVAA